MDNNIPTPQAQQHADIVRRLGELGFALPGTITERTKSCGKPRCRCHDDVDQRHGPYIQWTRTLDAKTVTRQLTRDQLDRYQPWFDNNRQLRELTDQLHNVSLDTITALELWGTASSTRSADRKFDLRADQFESTQRSVDAREHPSRAGHHGSNA